MIDTTIDVAGVAVRVRARTPALADCATSRLGTAPTTEAAEVDIELVTVAPAVPAGAAAQELDYTHGWEDDGRLWIGLDGARAMVDGTRVKVGGPVATDDELDCFDDVLQFAVAVAVARSDRLMMHAAVVARDDDALLLVGESGMGKSTLSAAALVAGWDLLGDDLAIVDTGSMRARGVARPPMVPGEVGRAHGLDGEDEDGPRGRIRLPASTLTPGSRRLIGIVSVVHGTDGHVEDLGRGDLAVLDAGFAAPPFRAALRRQFRASAALVALPAHRLAHAADERVRVRRAQELLDEVWMRCRAAEVAPPTAQ